MADIICVVKVEVATGVQLVVIYFEGINLTIKAIGCTTVPVRSIPASYIGHGITTAIRKFSAGIQAAIINSQIIRGRIKTISWLTPGIAIPFCNVPNINAAGEIKVTGHVQFIVKY